MKNALTLRPATIRDADLLLAWRNDPRTREASHDPSEIGKKGHAAWLAEILADRDRRLYVAEEDGQPVGTVRADLCEGGWELSWTTAPGARGRGVAKRMVAMLAERIPDPIRAEIKKGNNASARVAEHAGMALHRAAGGVLHYRRGARRE